jgi:hypothetical protein
MHRISLLLTPAALALGLVLGCTSSDPLDIINKTGSAGSADAAGTSGSAGTTGAAGTSESTGAAGTAAAGTTGAAGTSAQGTAGTGAGTAGTGGSGGTAGTGGGTAGTGGSGGVAATAGAAGAGADAGAALSFAKDIQPILTMRCTPCHITNISAGLSMKSPGYKNLVNVNATTTACTLLDATKKRVIPGNPDKSMMWIKLSQPGAALNTAKCGAAMPKSGMVTSNEMTMIHDWIMSGANQ